MRTFDLMIALHFVLEFENIFDSNMCILQWPVSGCSLVLGFSPYNQLSKQYFVA